MRTRKIFCLYRPARVDRLWYPGVQKTREKVWRMVMQGTPTVAVVDPLILFYVWNGVIALMVLVGGGTLWIAHRTAHPRPRFAAVRARQILLVGLGSLWIVDGLLQAQPLMVTAFVRGLLVPLLPGQPPW